MIFDKELTFFKAHERLVLAVLILGFLLVASDWGLNAWDRHEQRVYDKANGALAVATAKAQDDLAKAQADEQKDRDLAKQYQDLALQVLAQNNALEKAILTRDEATKKQQSADQNLPPSDLASRWELLADLPTDSITWTGAAFSATPLAAVQTTQKLEEVPKLTADLADVRAQVSGKDQQISKQNEVITGLNQHVTDLNSSVADLNGKVTAGDKACDARIGLLRAEARKSKLGWFLKGVATGAGIVLYLLH